VDFLFTIVLSLNGYFVQELFAAELFFAIGFVILLALVGVCYLVGAVGDRCLTLREKRAHNRARKLHLPNPPLLGGPEPKKT
jgi:hypothetical protein